MITKILKPCIHIFALMLLSISVCSLSGCEQKKKVLDVETPAGGLEIEKDKNSGSVGIEVKKKEDN